jgi:hypothetical protein
VDDGVNINPSLPENGLLISFSTDFFSAVWVGAEFDDCDAAVD